MDIQYFIERFAEAIEIEQVDALSAKTVFHNLDAWNSLALLSVIAMLDETFGVQIEMKELEKLVTIQDIFDKARSLQ